VAQHLELAGQWIGDFELDAIHADVLQDFIEHRQEVDEVSPTTINRTIGYISSVLLRAARVWRTDDGLPWLGTAPLLDRLDMTPRQPYPITWEEQARLFKELPAHLARMALFAVNTGLRSANVYGLRWAWERRVQGLDRSVFVIPATEFKTKRPHVAILNDVASKVLEECRGAHKDFVFTYQNELLPGKPIMPLKSMNNTAWREARKRAALPDLRVHDLRHTCAHRLRASGVSSEDRSVLMGHASSSMSEHYATPTIAHLIEMSNLANEARDAATILRVVQNSHAESHAQRKTA
jgi:integrase